MRSRQVPRAQVRIPTSRDFCVVQPPTCRGLLITCAEYEINELFSFYLISYLLDYLMLPKFNDDMYVYYEAVLPHDQKVEVSDFPGILIKHSWGFTWEIPMTNHTGSWAVGCLLSFLWPAVPACVLLGCVISLAGDWLLSRWFLPFGVICDHDLVSYILVVPKK